MRKRDGMSGDKNVRVARKTFLGATALAASAAALAGCKDRSSRGGRTLGRIVYPVLAAENGWKVYPVG